MEKKVIFNFPDDFKFPERWGNRKCTGCPFDTSIDDEPLCFLTGDCEYGPCKFDRTTGKIVYLPHPKCPFYNGADTVNYDDC